MVTRSVFCSCLVIGHAWLLVMSGYWSCLVIVHVWLLVMSGYWSCLVIGHVWLLVMSGYCSCLVIVHVWLLVMSGYWSCLVIVHVWLLVMPLLFNIGTFNFCIILLCSTCIYIYIHRHCVFFYFQDIVRYTMIRYYVGQRQGLGLGSTWRVRTNWTNMSHVSYTRFVCVYIVEYTLKH